MRTLLLKKSISISIIKQRMKNAKSISDFKRWQVIYFVSSFKVDAQFISEVTGYSKANIYAIVQLYNDPKNSDISIQKRGGRRRFLISAERESLLMLGLEKQALNGQVLSYVDIKKIVENEIGREVSNDFIWDLFKRNGWTKHTPRPHHPKINLEAQEEFKKNSKRIWLPQKMILPEN